jgi:glucosamine 6-phosphate synthetase-like amidotransferase/phosphosugar isomerase protein
VCGIVAYAGKKPAEPFLLKALQRLEYRGYDGFGYLLSDGDHWLIRRELIPASQAHLTEHTSCLRRT